MHICRLALDHFRSWSEVVVDFTPGVNVLHGSNGLGKTNLVEAAEVLSTGTSHRVSASLPLIERGASKATIRANVDDDSSVTTYEATIVAHGANRARINSGQSQYLRDIIGLVPSVSFTPEDQRLIYGEPSVRRNFLNQSGALLVPHYAEQLQRFTQIARQRAALLKQLAGREGMADSVLSGLEVWTGQFIEAGVELTRMRSSLMSRLAEPFTEIYARLASDNGKACLAYMPSFEEVLSSDDPHAMISAHFQRLYPGEVARGINLIGPQRDDLDVTLDGMSAKEFASNGEMWTMALALKMALFETVTAERGMKPIVILDDVFAQLDESRREQILRFAQNQEQVLITVAAASDIPPTAGANIIDVASLRESFNAHADIDAGSIDGVDV
ncbi:DNA replication/repair protein RecF [Bifidobacterium panos]|uniref:DNA replication and repair protein RecF n=1 Tax=Bifidobacterium panos TaxID=2675321 RepID=A0ABX1SVL5_9BIFI|nr:DNA replication and repair protein RecF [Bifidobacterium sp. DSM 109963]NMN01878.1 DNA recombination protein RecF [Bifidobacterium sp. DSM 109963]